MIAHDLATVKYMSTRIGVMYLGKTGRSDHSKELYANPLHPYAKALLSAALPLTLISRRRKSSSPERSQVRSICLPDVVSIPAATG